MKMRRLDILSTSSADLDPLLSVILECDKHFKVRLIVTGTHFSTFKGQLEKSLKNLADHGFLGEVIRINPDWNEHENSGYKSGKLLKALSESHTSFGDLVIGLGDRWELLPALYHWFLNSVPIIHLSGGEISYGAIDDPVRHAITKLSAVHMVSNNWCKKNLISLGEEDWRIRLVGEPSLDVLKKGDWRKADTSNLPFDIYSQKYFLISYHPCVFEEITPTMVFKNIVKALKHFRDYKVIVTSPGHEDDRNLILREILMEEKKNPNFFYIERLGLYKYLKVSSFAKCMIGNSSSFLIETPSLSKPTVNIGNRQNGRLKPASVLDCKPTEEDILKTLNKALDGAFSTILENLSNPYDINDHGVSSRIVQEIYNILPALDNRTLLPKKLVQRMI